MWPGTFTTPGCYDSVNIIAYPPATFTTGGIVDFQVSIDGVSYDCSYPGYDYAATEDWGSVCPPVDTIPCPSSTTKTTTTTTISTTTDSSTTSTASTTNNPTSTTATTSSSSGTTSTTAISTNTTGNTSNNQQVLHQQPLPHQQVKQPILLAQQAALHQTQLLVKQQVPQPPLLVLHPLVQETLRAREVIGIKMLAVLPALTVLAVVSRVSVMDPHLVSLFQLIAKRVLKERRTVEDQPIIDVPQMMIAKIAVSMAYVVTTLEAQLLPRRQPPLTELPTRRLPLLSLAPRLILQQYLLFPLFKFFFIWRFAKHYSDRVQFFYTT